MQKHVATFTKKNKEKNCEKGGGERIYKLKEFSFS